MAANKLTQKDFPVLGMSCASCAARVGKTLQQMEGLESAEVNYATGTVRVTFADDQVSAQAMKAAVQAAGYDLLVEEREDLSQQVDEAHEKTYRQLKWRTLWAVVLSLPIVALGMVWMDAPYANEIMWALSTPVVFWLGRSFFVNAFKQLKHGSANMDTLVALSTSIAYFFSVFNVLFPNFWLSRSLHPHVYFEASSVIIAFILIGRLLEDRAKGNTSLAIKKLMGLQPKEVTVLTEAGEQRVISIEQLQVGNVVVVRPGQQIAVDGSVSEGQSYVDESMLSGEPVPVLKEAGSKVYAGTINQRGSFRFVAEQVGESTRLAQIIRLVQAAQGSKAPVQKLVDKIASIFVPAIIAIAILAFVLWMVLDNSNGFTHGLLALVTVLVIACPCALGLATPTAIMVGMGKGAERGILIKDAESLETAARLSAVVLDKTGTITEGRPEVVHLAWCDEQELHAQLLFSMEQSSEHPLSMAITRHLAGTPAVELEQFDSITGKGVEATYQGVRYVLGNRRLIEELGLSLSVEQEAMVQTWAEDAKTVVYMASPEKVLALIGIADKVKETSVAAIEHLQQRGLKVYMLTGDQERSAAAMARRVGLTHYKAGVLPDEKADFIHTLRQEGHVVAMVGDGINDSAALAEADLGIAMGQGSDIAMDVAKMTIISSDLTKIAEAIELSKLTVRTIRQNLFWAFVYNLIGVPVAAGLLYPINGFLLNPMIAGAAMALSSVSVVTNSLRLRARKLSIPTVHVDATTAQQHMTNQQTPTTMIKEYQVEGMSCNHCRKHVEEALNGIEGVKAQVSLEPALATVEFSGGELSLAELQAAVSAAGDYKIVGERS